jgi:hypothetical protein
VRRTAITGILVTASLALSGVTTTIASAAKGPTWKTAEWAGTCTQGAVWGWYATFAECLVGGVPFPTIGGWNRNYGATKTLKAGESRTSSISNTEFEGAVPHKFLDAVASVECKTAKGSGAIEGGEPGKDTANTTLSSCKVLNKETKEEAKGCTVRSKGAAEGTIELKAKTELVYIGTKAQAEKEEGPVGDRYAPASGTTYVTLEFLGGKSCPAGSEGTTTVEGETIAQAAGGLEQSNEQVFPAKWIEKYFHWEGAKIAEVAVKRLKVFGTQGATETGTLSVFLASSEEAPEASPKG